MKKRFAVVICLVLIAGFCQNLFAEINVISPVKGTWANKQILVIDKNPNGDYFYSINGSDPERFGFAYDGPVLLDMNGNITLKITYVGHNGKKESTSVDFTVVENDAYNAPYGTFISSFYDTGLINYSAGSVITIPGSLQYSLGLPPDSFIPGQDLYLSEKSILTRCVPCVIWDKTEDIKWRFIIQTFPQTAGIYSRRDVPFVITDWDKITFTDKNLIYKIDSEYWELPKKSKKIDRTQSHMISWQNLEYETGNPVDFFVLPPKPEICSRTEEDGGVIYYIPDDESYSMSVLSAETNEYQELFTELGADTFFGDRVSGTMKIGIFTNSVYQGEMEISYRVDKRPPANPVITSNVQTFYSRENIKAHIQAETDSELYVAVSEPLYLTGTDTFFDENDPMFQNITADDFKFVRDISYDLELKPYNDGAVFYKVRAYSKSGDNSSQISEYKVLIDQYNYYYDAESKSELSDGTLQNPYKSFEQCLEAINKSSAVCLKAKGNIVIPEGKHSLSSNCKLVNDGGATLVFESGASLAVKNAGLELVNFRIIGKKGDVSTLVPLFKIDNSVLTLDNCECAVECAKNGTLIDAYKSVVNMSNSIVSVSSVSYASFISAVKSHLSIKDSTVNASADTCVLISASEGDLSVINNSLKVSGKTGRIAELFGAEALFEKNTFNAQLTKKTKMSALYADKNATLTDTQNLNYGF